MQAVQLYHGQNFWVFTVILLVLQFLNLCISLQKHSLTHYFVHSDKIILSVKARNRSIQPTEM